MNKRYNFAFTRKVTNEIIFNYSYKKREKKLQISSSKSIQKIEKITSLKSLFDPSRYLNRLLRYNDSKFPQRLIQRLCMESSVSWKCVLFFQESVACLELGIGQ